ncbi:MAG: phosphoenolpyruvate carboxylase [Halofilum sp. (in: g-proteobacteria)]|nr:phosphoenolpyruvate carboxylase [Halofilum sp. (in: g-proteobacteria)]
MAALNETREHHASAPEDAPLRADVRTLGGLVGSMISEQRGEDFYQAVESVRRAAIARRRGDEGAAQRLDELLHNLAADDAGELVRAFATLFQMVNVAEEVHRIRRLRERQRSGEHPETEGLEATFRALRESGFEPADVQGLLDDTRIEPVFTAHPTEATRRTILEKQQRIIRALTDRLDPSLTPDEERARIEIIRSEITSAWQTEEHPSLRPSVRDELEHVLFYLTDIIYRVVPPFYEEVEHTIEKVYGEGAGQITVPSVLRFASWVGGDMDGNPNVNGRTLRNALKEQRSSILARYRVECSTLVRALSQSSSRIGVDAAVTERVDRYLQMFPEAAGNIPPRHRQMPYRELVHLVRARLDATARDVEGAYPGPAEFIADIEAMATSLENNKGRHAGLFRIQRLLRRARTFGFHLATVDVRQDARTHRDAMGKCLGDPEWASRSAAERASILEQALAEGREPEPVEDEKVAELFDVFRAIGELRRQYGDRAIGCYIISMTQGRDDLLTVMLLARWAGLVDEARHVDLDVAPLFETVGDLEAGPTVMEQMLGDKRYREHLAGRGDRQVVMVGYSDSSKDGSLVASRWALQVAQTELVEVADRYHVDLTFFHGRGGTTSRGGGRIHRAILAAPRGSVRGRLRVTEQGEVIHTKYGVRSSAMRTLETSLAPVLHATGVPRPVDERESGWETVMARIAGASRAAYRGLVYEDERFFHYFRNATPIDVIERMAIGSRPPSRKAGQGIENLRAIPWVFAWTQSRQVLPGWFGLGSGLQAAVDEWGEERIAEMLRDWPFFANVVNDTEMVLAKVDLGIGEHYARLAGTESRPIYEAIRDEYERAVYWVLQLKGNTQLLDDERALKRSIGLRNPYMDPMSLLQVDLLERWRAADRNDDDLFRALLSTVNGIAHGLQQSG